MSEIENLEKYKDEPIGEILAASESLEDFADRSLTGAEQHREMVEDDEICEEFIRIYNAMFWRLTRLKQLSEGTHR